MRSFLLYPDRSAETKKEETGVSDVSTDLNLEVIISAMSDGDRTIEEIARAMLSSPMTDRDEILYREEIVKDAFAFPEVFHEMYGLCIDTEERRRSSWCWFTHDNVTSTFSSAITLMKLYLDMLGKLRALLGRERHNYGSRGMKSFLARLDGRFSDAFLSDAISLISELSENGGQVFSVSLGPNLEGVSFKAVASSHKGFFGRLLSPSFTLSERDDTGYEDLHDRREKALNEISDILARASRSLERFFADLEVETAFLVGALNLKEKLEERNLPISFPLVEEPGSHERSWSGLYDPALALTSSGIVGNDLGKTEADLYFITGANQGGKTTFLRSIGDAQIMMQAGLPVPARSFAAPVRKMVSTHFRREEERGMESGKLDEELRRMRDMAFLLKPGSLLLMNESFSSTDEREGSLIAEGLTETLEKHGIEIFSVTHLDEYASYFLDDDKAVFLRAEHLDDGSRTFRIIPGKPEKTAYGSDIWKKIFGNDRNP